MTERTTHLIDPARLEHGTWNHETNRDENVGDIVQSYSADTIALKSIVRKPFKHEGVFWTCTSMEGRGGVQTAQAYQLVQAFRFAGKALSYREKTGTSEGAEAARNDPMGFYHGMAVKSGADAMVLSGPPAHFVADPTRPTSEPQPEQMGLFA